MALSVMLIVVQAFQGHDSKRRPAQYASNDTSMQIGIECKKKIINLPPCVHTYMQAYVCVCTHTHTHLSFVSDTTRLMGIAILALGVEMQTPTEKLPLLPN